MSAWPIVRLGDVAKVVGGGTPAKSNPNFYGSGIPWVTPKDMKRWDISGAQIEITEHGLANSAARLVPEGAVLVVVRSGVLKHTLPVAIARIPVAINQDMKALLAGDAIDSDFLGRLIKSRSPEILQWVRATTADNFSVTKLMDMAIPLPPINEQRRIAAILDHADALRAKRREALARLDELTQSIFIDMFSPNTVQLVRQNRACRRLGGLWMMLMVRAFGRPLENLALDDAGVGTKSACRVDAAQ
ncbi:restriction endonuclease subunit S [Rhodococcus yananensis]|uniref:restriction endonuclease subunit S n=1 Tax=Rhodococcus yananensis TaxID=2879464 RepID=UPI003EBEECA1